jgi:hypothetical protein
MRDKKLKEWLEWFIVRFFMIMIFYVLTVCCPILIDPHLRKLNGIDDLLYWIDPIVEFIMIYFGGVL